MSDAGSYVLGHSEAELRRLAAQARLVDPITKRFFRAAGVAEGMRALDVGSGAGHTAVLLAELVGRTGEVVGADLAPAAIEAASRRVAALGLANVSFRLGDPAAMDFDRPFDVVAGRYALMFMPDPVASLERLARLPRPGGVVVFHEPDWDGARCAPPSPTYDRVVALVREALSGSGAVDSFGARLPAVFAAAGLGNPDLRLESVIAAGDGLPEAVRFVTDLAATLRPSIEPRSGAFDLASAETRILAEIGPLGIVVGRAEIGAFARVGGG